MAFLAESVDRAVHASRYASAIMMRKSAAGAQATETVMLDVSGMKCGGCSASVKRILLSNEGVQHAAVNLLTETAVVKLRPSESSAEQAAALLTDKVPHCEGCLIT